MSDDNKGDGYWFHRGMSTTAIVLVFGVAIFWGGHNPLWFILMVFLLIVTE